VHAPSTIRRPPDVVLEVAVDFKGCNRHSLCVVALDQLLKEQLRYTPLVQVPSAQSERGKSVNVGVYGRQSSCSVGAVNSPGGGPGGWVSSGQRERGKSVNVGVQLEPLTHQKL
jgi:hypothetical protein